MFKSALFAIFLVNYSAFANETCNNLNNDPLFQQIRANFKLCNAHDVHITFDDGPSLIATEKILNELKKRNTKATFFISTTNLEKGSDLQNLVLKEIEEGHSVGDHGHEHNAYDLRMINGQVEDKGYTRVEADEQINKSIKLLDRATNNKFSQQQTKLFRFPYGRGAMPSADELDYMESHGQITFRSNKYSERLTEYRKLSHPVSAISEKGFSHLGWNHDSQDFKYGVKNDAEINVKDFVTENLQRLCTSREITQVALFHDIKAINAKAIPLIIDIGKCLGLSFISADKMMKSSAHLTSSGVLIPKDYQLKSIVPNFQDTKEAVVKYLSPAKCEILTPPTYKACISSNGRSYKHCEGEDSICYNGEWISRVKAVIESKCNL